MVKRSLKFAAAGFVVVVLVLLVAGGLSAPIWLVEVRREVAASPAEIHRFVADLKRWPEWSGWNKEMDPEVVFSFAGPAAGEGASWSWDGPKMGRAKITITRADPNAGVWLEEAIQSTTVNAHGSITYAAVGARRTLVTWRDEGRLPPIVGGLMRAALEAELTAHFSAGLDRLAAAVGAGSGGADGQGDGRAGR